MSVDPYIHVNVKIPPNIGVKSIELERGQPDASQISIGYYARRGGAWARV